MPRETLDRQLARIKEEVRLLGDMVHQVMIRAVKALENRDLVTAQHILREDQLINEKRYAIENAVLILMATQQPIARDLRRVSAVLEVITELERMGDYAKGIAKVITRLDDREIPVQLSDFLVMAETALKMLSRALDAFLHENPTAAREIPKDDDAVDALYDKIHDTLVKAMIANPDDIEQANLIMWAAHNIERLADRVTNICERTVFVATGEMAEMDTFRSGDE
jgi:phosphate transport system protein